LKAGSEGSETAVGIGDFPGKDLCGKEVFGIARSVAEKVTIQNGRMYDKTPSDTNLSRTAMIGHSKVKFTSLSGTIDVDAENL